MSEDERERRGGRLLRAAGAHCRLRRALYGLRATDSATALRTGISMLTTALQ